MIRIKTLRTLFTALMLLLVGKGFAQDVKRVEIDIPANANEFFAIPLADKGVVVMSQVTKNDFNLIRFDTNLQQLWSINGTVGNNLDYVKHAYDGQNLYLLFSRYNSNVFEIIKVNLGPGFIEKFQILTANRLEVSDFQAINSSIFIAGVSNSQPIVSYTNLVERKTKILPSALKNQAEIQSMELDTTTNLINVTYAVGTRGKNYQLVLKSFDENGTFVEQIVMDPQDEFAMMNGRLNQVSDSTQILFGTYGYKNSIGGSKGPTSQGIYFSKFIHNEEIETKFHSFTDFKNFFNYLGEKAKSRQERKISDKKDKGDDLRLDYRILVHDVIKKGNEYILVAEAFYANYRYNNNNINPYGLNSFNSFASPWSSMYSPARWGWGNYGLYSPYSSYYSPWGWNNRYYGNQQTFDGWIYTHAIIAGFDEKGNLLWDNSIELKDVKQEKLSEKVRASFDINDKITLSYCNNGDIFTKIIQGNEVIEDTQKRSIAPSQESDKIKRTISDNINYWFGNYFLASGIQRITNNEEGAKRNVFYLNKLKF